MLVSRRVRTNRAKQGGTARVFSSLTSLSGAFFSSRKEKARDLARQGIYRRIPVCREILSDFTSPIQALRILQGVSRHCYLLESAEDHQRWGRYTFLGYHPSLEVTCTNGTLSLRRMGAPPVREAVDHPGRALRRILEEYRSPRLPGLPPFTGGLVGYFSYDYVRYAEPSLRRSENPDPDDAEGFRDCDLMLFDKVIAFDNFRQKLIFIANADADCLEDSYPAACRELDAMVELVRRGTPAPPSPGRMETPLRELLDLPSYCAMVEKGKGYIREGDIFQVVLSNRLEAEFSGSLLDAYRILRTTNPSPYLFYFSSDDLEIAGASPETLVKLEDGILHTFPLAGTRPRGRTPEEDARLEQELLSDEKERAEHNMLVVIVNIKVIQSLV